MALLAAQGEVAAALAQYERCRQILEEELGTTPTAATRALYQRLEQAAAAPAHNLPPQPTPFVGRREELVTLRELLADTEIRLITVVGPGGMGKTRLALEAAAGQTESFLHGVAYVPLVAVKAAEGQEQAALASAIVEALAAADFIPRPGRQAPTTHLHQHLADKEMLLLLDNAEHLLPAVPLLLDLLDDAPGVQLLLTSRARLNVRWERLLPVRGLDIPPDAGAEGWCQYDAVRLFLQTARRVHPGFALSDDDRAAITRICDLSRGMPLALELAASWVRVQSCTAIARQMADTLDVLATTQRDRPERHQSVRAAFAHSWHLLRPGQRHLLRHLSVFQSSFTADAAHAVALPDEALPSVWQSLATLADRSLLQQTVTAGVGLGADGDAETIVRYEMHPLLRHYAANRLAEDLEAVATVQARHATYYLTFIAERDGDLRGGPRQAAGLREIAVELNNLLPAWQWAAAQGCEDLVADALFPFTLFFRARERWQQGATVLGEIAEAMSGSSLQRARLQAYRAYFVANLGRYQEAEEMAAAALTVGRAEADAELTAAALYALGMVAYNQGEYSKASRLTEEALALEQQREDRLRQAFCELSLGLIATVQFGHHEDGSPPLPPQERSPAPLHEGESHYRRALALYRETGYVRGETITLHNLGHNYYSQARGASGQACQSGLQKSILHFEQALALHRKRGSRGSVGQTLNWMARAYALLEEGEQAGAYFREGLKVALAEGVTVFALDILCNIVVEIWLPAGRVAEATSLLAFVANHPATDARMVARAENYLGKTEEMLSPGPVT